MPLHGLPPPRGLPRPHLPRFAGSALVCILLAAGVAGAQEHEDHEPIWIDGSTVSHAKSLAGLNGVRSGSGTSDDPFIISGWRIDAEDDAVYMHGVNQHYILRDLHLSTASDGRPSLTIVDARNVVLEDITVVAPRPWSVTDSSVTAAGITLTGSVVCLDLERSTLEVRDLTVSGCPARDATLKGTDATIYGLRLSGPGLEVVNGSLLLREASIQVGHAAHTRQGIDAGADAELDLEAIHITCDQVPGARQGGTGLDLAPARGGLRIHNVTVEDCEDGVRMYENGAETAISGLTIRGASTGIDCRFCDVEIDGATLEDVALAVYVGGGHVTVRDYDGSNVTVRGDRFGDAVFFDTQGMRLGGESRVDGMGLAYVFGVVVLALGAVVASTLHLVRR